MATPTATPSGETGSGSGTPAPAAPSTVKPIPPSPSPASGGKSGASDGGAAGSGAPSGGTAAPVPGGTTASADGSAHEPARTPDGRFTSPRPQLPGVHPRHHPEPRRQGEAGVAKKDGGDATPAPPGSQPAPGDASPTEKFTFAGVEFKSREEAEQNLRTLRGQFKAFQKTADDAKAAAAASDAKFHRANDTARQWKERAGELERENQELRGQGAQGARPEGAAPPNATAPTEPALPESAEDVIKGLDMGFFQQLAEQSGPHVAAVWALKEALGKILPGIRAELGKVSQPFNQYQAGMRATSQMRQIVTHLAGLTEQGPDGTPVQMFPELHDPNAMRAIAVIHQKLGFSPETALTPQALVAAISQYRIWKQRMAAAGAGADETSTAAPPTTPPNPLEVGTETAPAAAAQPGNPGGTHLSGPSLPQKRGTAALTPADKLREEVRNARGPDPVLGFVRRR